MSNRRDRRRKTARRFRRAIKFIFDYAIKEGTWTMRLRPNGSLDNPKIVLSYDNEQNRAKVVRADDYNPRDGWSIMDRLCIMAGLRSTKRSMDFGRICPRCMTHDCDHTKRMIRLVFVPIGRTSCEIMLDFSDAS